MARTKNSHGGPGKSHTEELYSSRTEETLSEAAKIFRDAFVREYIKDFKGQDAMIRCGVANPKTAKVRAYQLLREPYVARKLDETVRQLRPEDVVTRGQVMAKLWEEANNPKNMCSTRVNATAHVAKMLGMGRQEDSVNSLPVGVMLIPATSPEDWAQAAAVAQAMLKAQAAKHSA